MITFSRKQTSKPKSSAQLKKDLQLKIELDEIEREARFKREQQEHERDAWRKDVAEIDTEAAKASKIETWRRRGRKMIPYIPLIIVNSAALQGQFSWAFDHLRVGEPETLVRIFAAVIYAVAVESIALFLQYYANRALRNRDSAGLLYFSAFLVAGLVATINFSHYYDPKTPLWNVSVQATAYAFALCSLISPWLWRIHSRAEHREALKAAGEIDSRGVKLSLSRKFWHPIKSIRVVSMAAWSGETNPAKAVEAWEAYQSAQKIVAEEGDKVRDEAHRRKVTLKNQRQPKRVENLNGDLRQHPKYADAVRIFTESKRGPGRPLSQRALAKAIDMANRKVAEQAIKDVNSANNGLRTAP